MASRKSTKKTAPKVTEKPAEMPVETPVEQPVTGPAEKKAPEALDTQPGDVEPKEPEQPAAKPAAPLKKYKVEDIAKVCHEANRAYCQTIGDRSQDPWERAPEWQRASALNGVRFHLANPDSAPEDSHNNWLAEKEAAGWKYGPKKDEKKKEHPCMVPYAELPLEQRRKDALFIAVIRALTAE